MTSTENDLITRNRARRERASRRKRLLLALAVAALVASMILDRQLDVAEDAGTGPFAVAIAGCVYVGLLWADARRGEGIERLILGRATTIAAGMVLLYATGAYIAWLVAGSTPAPSVYLHVAGFSLMVGVATGGIGIASDDE